MLKKYKREVTSEFDRWYVCSITPATPNGEYGDMYAVSVMRDMEKTFDCFAPTSTDEQTSVTE